MSLLMGVDTDGVWRAVVKCAREPEKFASARRCDCLLRRSANTCLDGALTEVVTLDRLRCEVGSGWRRVEA